MIFIAIAAFLNAVMDVLKDHFNSSVFKDLDPNFWKANVSWKRKILFYTFDAWHLVKTAMIIILIGFAVDFEVIDWALFGLIWNVVFELSYRVLKQ